ncbi:MAG: isoprenyl transferase [Eubacterium sp.]|nr:isoprenyl transferase [Eubacterium sp.]
MKIPQHIAIILDGNGRWAKSKGMPRTFGHTKGADNVEVICKAADELGVKYLTFYAFSTENWKRPQEEVNKLMSILRKFMKTAAKRADDNNMRVRIIGDITALDEDLQVAIKELEKSSESNTGLNMQIAINYGSRDEIVRAVNSILEDAKSGRIEGKITEDVIGEYLDTAGIPDPDLMIRTSGEQRLSNYLLWQLAYSEFYFCDTPWPAFTPDDLKAAIEEYSSRDRRYGKIKEET